MTPLAFKLDIPILLKRESQQTTKAEQHLSVKVHLFLEGRETFLGNRIFNRCDSGKPDDLCVPCEKDTFTTDPSRLRCDPCRECAGALVFVAACTTTRDTQCGCREGLRCGDSGCTFCVTECGKGQEPDNHEPRTLCTPTECSFHEPLEEEEASSSESLVTEDSEGSEGSTRKLMV
ncbi:unnamed protein product [Merluccius merluccius]